MQECYVHLVYQMSVWTVLSIFWCFIVVPRQLASTSRHFTRVAFRHRGVNFGYRSSRASWLLITPSFFFYDGFYTPLSPPLRALLGTWCRIRDAFCRSVHFFLTRFSSVPTSRKATNFGPTSGFMHVFREAIARPPYYSRSHQRTSRTSALPGQVTITYVVRPLPLVRHDFLSVCASVRVFFLSVWPRCVHVAL